MRAIATENLPPNAQHTSVLDPDTTCQANLCFGSAKIALQLAVGCGYVDELLLEKHDADALGLGPYMQCTTVLLADGSRRVVNMYPGIKIEVVLNDGTTATATVRPISLPPSLSANEVSTNPFPLRALGREAINQLKLRLDGQMRCLVRKKHPIHSNEVLTCSHKSVRV